MALKTQRTRRAHWTPGQLPGLETLHPPPGSTTRSPGACAAALGPDPTYPKQLIGSGARSGRTICLPQGEAALPTGLRNPLPSLRQESAG